MTTVSWPFSLTINNTIPHSFRDHDEYYSCQHSYSPCFSKPASYRLFLKGFWKWVSRVHRLRVPSDGGRGSAGRIPCHHQGAVCSTPTFWLAQHTLNTFPSRSQMVERQIGSPAFSPKFSFRLAKLFGHQRPLPRPTQMPKSHVINRHPKLISRTSRY